MPDVLICADTIRSPELRHEVPIAVPDPFLYGEAGGARHVLVHSMEAARMGGLGLELHLPEQYGYDDLVKQGMPREEITLELVHRACLAWGVRSAVVPRTFPLEIADSLRGNGVELVPDRDFFESRRRVKNEEELAGIRRAQHAAHEGMAAARELLRAARPDGSSVLLNGAPLTCERIKRAIEEKFADNGCSADEMVVSHGAQSAIGHHMGEGPIAPGESVVIDIWPRDRDSACYADMTRTFVVGEPPAELVEWHALVLESLEKSIAAIRAGVVGASVNDVACEVFEREGLPTPRTKPAGVPLEEGFYHGLGHGVGLEVHESPYLGKTSRDDLLAGDVVTVEPGLYRPGFGGVRLEDLVVVTEDGAENLTDFPYDLTP